MKHIYIDESGSMTFRYSENNGYFVFSLLDVVDRKKLKRVIKRYVSKNFQQLKDQDVQNKMFKDDHFVELKGQCFSPQMKIDFANYLAKNNLFKVFIGRIDNRFLKDDKLYLNKARAFNFVLKCVLTYYIHQGKLPTDEYIVQIDERNTKTFSLNSLNDYLYIDLVMDKKIMKDISVEYFRSEDNSFIQIADFFANLYFSFLHNPSKYKKTINMLREQNYLIDDFVFPLH